MRPDRERRHPLAATWHLCLMLILCSACGDGSAAGPGDDSPSARPGAVTLVTETSGSATDPDGYRFRVGGDTVRVSANGTRERGGVPAGSVTVQVEDVATHCSAADTEWTIQVVAGQATEVKASVDCFGEFAYTRAGLYYVGASGEHRKLTGAIPGDVWPLYWEWSPDGKRIAFSVTPGSDPIGEDRDLFVVDVASGVTTRLTDRPLRDWWPNWSPDGSELVFLHQRTSGLADDALYRVSLDGLVQSALWEHPSWSPVWSPDGTRIAFVGFGFPANGLAMISVPDRTATVLRDGWVDYPAWAPDGKWISYLTARPGTSVTAVAAPAEGGEPVELGPATSGPRSPFVWSSDGSTVFFIGLSPATGFAEIAEAHPGDGSLEWLTSDGAKKGLTLSLSPDGRHLLYARSEFGLSGAQVLDLQTATHHRLALDSIGDIKWRPAGGGP